MLGVGFLVMTVAAAHASSSMQLALHHCATTPIRCSRAQAGRLRLAHHPHMVADYTSAASALFANVRLPASILAGALMPLGFGFLLPAEGPAYSTDQRRLLVRLHRVVATCARERLSLGLRW